MHDTLSIITDSEIYWFLGFCEVPFAPEQYLHLVKAATFLRYTAFTLGEVFLDDSNKAVTLRPHLLVEKAHGVHE